jgi:hypothetical protein
MINTTNLSVEARQLQHQIAAVKAESGVRGPTEAGSARAGDERAGWGLASWAERGLAVAVPSEEALSNARSRLGAGPLRLLSAGWRVRDGAWDVRGALAGTAAAFRGLRGFGSVGRTDHHANHDLVVASDLLRSA